MMIAWELHRGGGDDGGLVADGSFSAALLGGKCVATGGALIVASHSVQLVPLVRTNARVLLDKQQNISEEPSRTLTFSIASSALALAHPTTATASRPRSAAPVVEPQQLLQCTLKLVGAAPTPPVLEEHDSTWFDVKLRRAGEWRARGNDAFKESKLARAVRAYRKVRERNYMEYTSDRELTDQLVGRRCSGSRVRRSARTTTKKLRPSRRSHSRATRTSRPATGNSAGSTRASRRRHWRCSTTRRASRRSSGAARRSRRSRRSTTPCATSSAPTSSNRTTSSSVR